MKRARLAGGLVALGMFTAAAYWPVPRVDVPPGLQRPVPTPTETVIPLGRPTRPPHPSSIYTPPGSHR